MIRLPHAAPGLVALLLVGTAPAALAASPPPAADPLAACLAADSAPAMADRKAIVADCDQALASGKAAADQKVRALVSRSLAQWRLDRYDLAEADAEAALKLAPGDIGALLARGVARLHADRPDPALEDFNAVLKVQPNNAEALLYRGRARQWHKNDPAGARADYDAALAADPKLLRAYFQRSDLIAKDDPAGAERDLKTAMALAPNQASAWLALGSLYEGQDRIKDALKAYEDGARAEPGNPHPLLYSSRLRRWQGDAAGALRDADRAAKVAPDLAEPHVTRAHALAALKRPDDALAAYGEALRQDPDDVGALIGMGFQSRHAKRLDEAMTALDKAMKLAPDNADAPFERALVWAAKDDPAKALADYAASIAIRPSAAAHYNRGQLLAIGGDHKAALAEYRKAAELDPKDPDALNAIGIELSETGGGEEELKAYQAALKVDPDNIAARINSAIYHAEREDWAASAASYRSAMVLQPRRADLHTALGESLARQGQADEARRAFDQALKLDAKTIRAWSGRAGLHQQAGRLREAIADFDRAVALAPDDADLRVNRASVLSLNGKDALAMADLDAAVRLAPTSAYVHNNRGLTNTNAERFDAALDDYGRAIAAEPDYEPAWYNRADVFIAQDRYDRAIRDLNVSLRLSPGDSMTLARKGYVYLLLKDYRRAEEELNAALEGNPDYVQALRWRAEARTERGDTAGAAADRKRADALAAG